MWLRAFWRCYSCLFVALKKQSNVDCAVGATFWTATNEEERSMAKKEFRRGSIRRVLSRIKGSDQGPRFELFRDCTDVFECPKSVRATSRSSSDLFVVWCPKPVWNFFFLSRFLDHQKWICDTETRKSQSKMWIAPVLRPRTVPNMVQDQITVRLNNISQTSCCGGRHT